MRLKIFLTAMLLVGWSVSPLSALMLDDGPDSFYGKGVHAFFAGDYHKAYAELSKAVDAKTIDPRIYLFRGLALRHIGRIDASKKDFQQGARLEVSKTNYFFDVNKALRRIQGKERLVIEQAREAARVESQQTLRRRAALRYEATKSQEGRVLRKSVPTKLAPTFAKQDTSTSNRKPKPKAKPAAKPAEAQKPSPKPKSPEAKRPSVSSKHIRADRFFQALSGSIGDAVMRSLPGAGLSGGAAPAAQPPAANLFDSDVDVSDDTPATEAPAQDENPFKSSQAVEPAAEFSKVEDMPLDASEHDLLVVTFPPQQDPQTPAAPPAPTFAKAENIVEVPAETPIEAVAETAVETPVESLIEEPVVENPAVKSPEFETLVVKESAPEKPVIEEPVVEEPTPEKLAVEESVPAVKEPALEKPVVEEPAPETLVVKEPAPAPKQPIVEEPAPETLAVKEPAPAPKQPIVEEPAPETLAVKEPAPAPKEPIVEEPAPETLAIKEPAPAPKQSVVEKPVIEEPLPEKLAVEEPVSAPTKPAPEKPIIEEPAPETLAVEEPAPAPKKPEPAVERMLAKKEPVAIFQPVPPGKELVIESTFKAQASVAKTAVSKRSTPVAPPTPDVAAVPVEEKSVKRPASPETEKIHKTPSGASAIPSLDLEHLPPEDDPFA